LVCAASRGLGYACAAALASEGVWVTLMARRPDVLAEAVESIRRSGGTADGVVGDVASAAGRQDALAACPDPDILITNCGGPPRIHEFRALQRADWHALLDSYLIAPIELIKATVDGMMRRRFGRIVNIGSIVNKMPGGSLELSAGARLAFTGFAAGLARQVIGANVTINHALPGSLATDRVRGNMELRAERAGVTVEDMYARRAAEIPAGRIGDPAEFGAACAYLCSAQAGYITGQSLLVDGGIYPGAF
jgi:3-oxoacyl-[acyl-carrier protein] reductase